MDVPVTFELLAPRPSLFLDGVRAGDALTVDASDLLREKSGASARGIQPYGRSDKSPLLEKVRCEPLSKAVQIIFFVHTGAF